ncbi:Gfo/Idh/MocA family oxidoreductase [soil metagenome]
MTDSTSNPLTRRTFVRAAALTSAALGAGVSLPTKLHAFTTRRRESADVIRIGLVGCGGRGTGAARDALRGSERVELVALGDLFPDRLESCRANLAKLAGENPAFGAKYKVTAERTFTGFDAVQKVLDSDIDLVILATPPGFRPMHLAAAVAAGKHIFTEKPVAVDAAGVRSVIATAALAKQKSLAVVAGTQRRHDPGYRETIKRLHDGAIGEITSGQVFWNQGGLWHAARKSEWSDTEWQIRNWLYFTWLSGDHVVEQHIHNIDVANWVMGGHPVKAEGVGGRQQRTAEKYGHIYDHFAVDFEYANGQRVLSMCRQMDGTANHIGESFTGDKGRTDPKGIITSGKKTWMYPAAPPAVNPYVQEHTDLVASIRAGKPLNELVRVAETTLTAIMAREAAYTGQVITWDALMASPLSVTPSPIAFGSMPVPPVAMPGQTKLDRTWSAL